MKYDQDEIVKPNNEIESYDVMDVPAKSKDRMFTRDVTEGVYDPDRSTFKKVSYQRHREHR